MQVEKQEDVLKPDSGLFSKDQTLAALRHARNRQYLCVYSCSDQLDPSACTEKVINLMKRALKPDRLHQAWTSSSLPACWCWHPCNKLPSHPKSHDMILSFFFLLLLLLILYILTFLSRSRRGSRVLVHHFFIAKMSLPGIGWEVTAGSAHLRDCFSPSSRAIRTG